MTGTGSPGLARPPRPIRHARRAKVWLTGGTSAFGLLMVALFAFRSDPPPYTPGTDAANSEEITRRLDREVPAEAPRITFTDVAEAAGLRFRHFSGQRSSQLPEDMGSGLAWGDYDGDGDPDLYLVNESGPLTTEPGTPPSTARSALYRNDGRGGFTDVTAQAGVEAGGLGMGAAWGDYDGDGDLDLAVTRFGTSLLYRNEGDGKFRDLSSASGLDRQRGFWTGASWGDYDRDGDLDLYICGYVQYQMDAAVMQQTSYQFGALVPFTLNPSSYPPERNLLFRNDGGRFREVARAAGVDNLTGRSLSASWCDFDGDGFVDLYVANDVSDNAMYRNRGDGTFEDVSHPSWAADHRGAMGLGIGDWENDGDFDIFITHWIAQENALFENQNEKMPPSATEPTRFIDQADMLGLGHIALDYVGWGTGFLDYDNDGWLDIFTANGSTFQKEEDPTRLVPMKNLLFWNAGVGKGYFEVGPVSGESFAVENVGRGAASADYDQDGDLDIAVAVNGGPVRLLRNEGPRAGSWMRIVLRGPTRAAARSGRFATPRFAEGAVVKARAGSLNLLRQIGAGSSYLSQDPPGETHLGLKDAGSIDELEIQWPSGRRDSFRDLPARSTVTIVEGEEPRIEGGAVAASTPAAAAGGDPASRQGEVRRFWALMGEATAARTRGDFDAAAGILEQALEIDPAHEDALYYLGQSRRHLGRYDGAQDAFARLVAANRSSARGHLALGALLAPAEEAAPCDLARAERHLRLAHEINKEETGAMVRLGEVLIARERYDDALEWLLAAARTNPKSVEAPFLAGYLAWQRGDLGEARRLYQAARVAGRVEAPIRGVLSEGDKKSVPASSQRPAPAPAPGGQTLLGQFAAPIRKAAASAPAGPPADAELSAAYGPLRDFIKSFAKRCASSLPAGPV